MKDTAKKVASSSALAHALAMTAMLIIASCIFYIRKIFLSLRRKDRLPRVIIAIRITCA